MVQINIHEAKTHFPRLVDRAAAGEEIIISKSGKPMAKLVPLQQDLTPGRFGLMKGEMYISDDFDAPLPPDVLVSFYGEGEEEDLGGPAR